MSCQEATLELDMGQQTGSKLEKEYIKVVYCHLAYLTYTLSKCMCMLSYFSCVLLFGSLWTTAR